MKKFISAIKVKAFGLAQRTRQLLRDKRGEGFVDSAIFS
jgi:hypothetical protein